MVLRWVLVALDAAVDSEVDSTEAVAVSEVVVVVPVVEAASIAAVVDASATVAMVHLMEHLLVLAGADLVVAVMEVADMMIAAHAATLTLSLCLLEEATVVVTVVEIAVATVTVIATATALVGMLDRSDPTMAVGMTTQDRVAATEWPPLDT